MLLIIKSIILIIAIATDLISMVGRSVWDIYANTTSSLKLQN